MTRLPAIGIDLGTTYSAVARLDEHGRPETLANAEGDRVTPSVVLFEPAGVVVGKEALKAVAAEAQNVALCTKRELGARVFHQVLQGRRYPPEAIEALILHKLHRDAQRHVGPFTQVVITVPAYFDEVRRKATQDAGYMAGLEVMDIINEPTAAAIAHGFLKGTLAADGTVSRPERLLVYDLGGGTFDVTVMEVQGHDFTTLATDGDVMLGGYDWDQRLVDYVAEEFARQHGLEPRRDPSAAGRLWRDCEDAKRTLSARQKAVIHFDWKSRAVRVELTREKFEELTRDLLERTQFTTRSTLRAAGLAWKDIDRVLLVGGSTRMPMVPAMLAALAGKPPDGSVAVDEAVAHGAAIRAGILLAQSQGEPPKVRIRNVNSHSLGVVATDAQTNRPRNAIVIPRNSQLPISARRTFRTQKVGQKSIFVQIVEGESSNPDECAKIGQCAVRDLPADLPAMAQIEVRFHYQENGRLNVRVTVAGTDTELVHELARDNSLTGEQLDAWRKYIAELPGSDVP